MRPPKPLPKPAQIDVLVSTAFTGAQRTHAAHPRAAKLLISAHSASPLHFLNAFTHALNRVLLVFSRAPAIERLVSFIATFAATHTHATGNFCSLVLVYLLEQSNATSPAVRFRAVQLVAEVLHRLSEGAELDDAVWEPLRACVMSRAVDRVPRVRAAAAAALCRLQTSGELHDDLFATRLVEMLATDSSAAVRKAALQAVAVTPDTLPAIARRTRDVRPDVRKVAFEVLAAKLHPSLLPVEDRVTLLKVGLEDRDASVRRAATEAMLFEGYFEGACEGNPYELLELLGWVDNEEVALMALRVVFASEKYKDLSDALEIDVNNLKGPDVLVLRALADTQKEIGFMEKFIPHTSAYAKVLRYYSVDDFAARHLLELCKSVDMSDEAGRKTLEEVVRYDFLASQQIGEATVVGAVRTMRRAMLESEATTRLLLEVVRHDVLQASPEEKLEEDDQKQLSPSEKSSANRDWKELRALNICREVLKISPQGSSTSAVINTLCSRMLELAVLPQLMSVDVEKRRAALESLGLYSLLDRSGEQAQTNMPLFLQASKNDVPEIEGLASQVLVDFLMIFDFTDDARDETALSAVSREDDVDSEKSAPETVERPQSTLSHMAEDCINLLSLNITHTDGSMRSLAVQGLARLLFVGRIAPNAILLSRLLIAHHNPTTEDDDELRQCLSVFFPAFAISSSANRLALEDSFKQTCSVLLEAPSKSPLSAISVVQVAQFILHLTNPATVPKRQKRSTADTVGRSATQIHERLAEVVLNEIIDAVQSDEVDIGRTYCRILSSFRLSCTPDNKEVIGLLQKLARTAMYEADDKRIVTAVKKFKERQDAILEKLEESELKATPVVSEQVEAEKNSDRAEGVPGTKITDVASFHVEKKRQGDGVDVSKSTGFSAEKTEGDGTSDVPANHDSFEKDKDESIQTRGSLTDSIMSSGSGRASKVASGSNGSVELVDTSSSSEKSDSEAENENLDGSNFAPLVTLKHEPRPAGQARTSTTRIRKRISSK